MQFLQFLGNHMPIRKIYKDPSGLPSDLEHSPKPKEDKDLTRGGASQY
jgi:hypothetical protein